MPVSHGEQTYIKMEEQRTCLECGRPVLGRHDKKFCTDSCRNAYNNKLNSDANNLIRNINNTLRKNRRIIAELIPDGKGKSSKSRLLDKGFDFTYHTHTYTTKTGATYYYCYDYGYLELDNDWYVLVKRE